MRTLKIIAKVVETILNLAVAVAILYLTFNLDSVVKLIVGNGDI